MTTNQQKLINRYKLALELGRMPKGSGLCREVNDIYSASVNLDLFRPTTEDMEILHQDKQRTMWWGGEDLSNPTDLFTELRQTVLAFLIAMEEE